MELNCNSLEHEKQPHAVTVDQTKQPLSVSIVESLSTMSKDNDDATSDDDEEISEIYQGQPVLHKPTVKKEDAKLSAKTEKPLNAAKTSRAHQNLSTLNELDKSSSQHEDVVDIVEETMKLSNEKKYMLLVEGDSNSVKTNTTKSCRTTRNRRSTSNKQYNVVKDDADSEEDSDFVLDSDEEYMENLDNSEDSDEDFIVGKSKKRKSRKKSTRKSSLEGHSTRRYSQPSRRSQRSRSQTSYIEKDSDDDCCIGLLEGQPYSGKDSETLSNEQDAHKIHSVVLPHPLKASDRCSSYNLPLASESGFSDEEEMTLLQGQPMVIKQTCKKLTKNSSHENQASHEILSCFLVQKEHADAVKNLPFSDSNLKDSLCIWKLSKDLLQKFVQVNSTKVFKSTNNYLGFYEENKANYSPIGVAIVNHNEDMVKIVGSWNNSETGNAIMNYALAQSKEVKPRGRPKSTQNTPKPVKRKNSNQGDTWVPRKRGRPRKNPPPAPEPNSVNQPPNENSSPDVETSSLSKDSFRIHLELLPNPHVDRSNLQDTNDTDATKAMTVEKRLSQIAEELLKLANNTDNQYMEDLKSKPVIQMINCSPGHLCEATRDNSDVVADKVAIFSGKRYSRDTLTELTEEVPGKYESKYFVSSKLAAISNAFHQLHHYNFNLHQKCRLKSESEAKQTPHSDRDNASPDSNNDIEIFSLNGTGDLGNEISALVQEVITKVVLNHDHPNTTTNDHLHPQSPPSTKIESSCLNEAWIDQNFMELTELIEHCEAILKDPA